MRVVYWGTYDTGKPRNRIMIRGLRENGVEVVECHADVWKGVEDKSQLHAWPQRLRAVLRWLLSYPGLLLQYFRLPKHDIVVIGYMGQLDVLVLWPFARLTRMPIVWDAFMSLYNTVVEDRELVSPRHLLSRLLFALDWLACRAAGRIILDTQTHGQHFVDTFDVPPEKVGRVFLGAETDVFTSTTIEQVQETKNGKLRPFTVLFYGQYIPLQGIETVVRAAKLTEGSDVRWVLIGKGQESPRICNIINELKLSNLYQIEWVPYRALLKWIQSADVCLGIFGTTDKAQRVIPNKVFQILAAAKPLITGDTPAMRELVSPSRNLSLVPLDDPQALAAAIRMMQRRLQLYTSHGETLHPPIGPKQVGQQLISEIATALHGQG